MALYLPTQELGAAPCGNISACSGLPLGSVNVNCSMQMAAPGGPKDVVGGYSGFPIERTLFCAQTILGEPGVAFWAAGDWTIRLHVITGTQSGMSWTSVYVCRVDALCTSIVTIASAVGSQLLTPETVYAVTIPGISHLGDPTDSIYVVFGFKKAAAAANRNVAVRCDQVLDTPILLPVPALPLPRESAIAPVLARPVVQGSSPTLAALDALARARGAACGVPPQLILPALARAQAAPPGVPQQGGAPRPSLALAAADGALEGAAARPSAATEAPSSDAPAAAVDAQSEGA